AGRRGGADPQLRGSERPRPDHDARLRRTEALDPRKRGREARSRGGHPRARLQDDGLKESVDMKVEEICTRVVRTCTKETRLSEAGNLMWDGDCGILPVVDEAGRVVGVVTDRDLCMALSLTGQPATEVPVRLLLRTALHTCRLGDSLRDALRTM